MKSHLSVQNIFLQFVIEFIVGTWRQCTLSLVHPARVKEHTETSLLNPYRFSYIVIPIARIDTFLAIFLLFFLLLATTSKERRNSYSTNVTSATLTKTCDVEISPIMEPRYARPRLPKSTRAFAHFQLSFSLTTPFDFIILLRRLNCIF